jgi:hypothetical protein
MKHPARMTRQPCPHGGVLVGGVVVENDVNDLADRDLAFNGVEEADELLMAMTLHVLPEDDAVSRDERFRQIINHCDSSLIYL